LDLKKAQHKPSIAIDDVMNFFEELGLLLESKALKAEPTWILFYYWTVNYYEATKIYRKKSQSGDPNLYDGFEYLLKELTRIELEKLKEKNIKHNLKFYQMK
jgi:hypothetical protein